MIKLKKKCHSLLNNITGMPVMPDLPSTPGGPGAPCLTCSANLAMMELSLQPQTPPPFFGFRKSQSIKMITTKYAELSQSGAKSEVPSLNY
jgi:hypothetical protein